MKKAILAALLLALLLGCAARSSAPALNEPAPQAAAAVPQATALPVSEEAGVQYPPVPEDHAPAGTEDREAPAHASADTGAGSTAQPDPQESVEPSDAEATPSEAASAPQEESAEGDLSWVTGEYQRSNHCTSCATATLIRRRQAADGKEPTFTYEDVRMCCNGVSRTDVERGRVGDVFYYSPANGYRALYSGADDAVYQPRGFTLEEMGETPQERLELILAVLEDHPEGLVLYVDHGDSCHAIVLSRYDAGTGSFYAYDPCGDGSAAWSRTKHRYLHDENETCRRELPLEETYLARCFEDFSIEVLLASLTMLDVRQRVCVWFLPNDLP